MNGNTHLFTIAEQDNIMINARSAAFAQSPGGKQVYRLTFARQVASPNSVLILTAYYGYCVTIRRVDGDPTSPQ
ncbi:MAG: hypothetical protein JOZ90_08105 [Alphaproteobacteria bacterium]|nr:hypothetical protein [Alphaproteobacteria bacterium]MBV9371610.1 hypothetical protein [Alphaproteobacteria bacterium]MBV9901047.1 hypothetical protein [Alphaproteobacteria bacterium]